MTEVVLAYYSEKRGLNDDELKRPYHEQLAKYFKTHEDPK